LEDKTLPFEAPNPLAYGGHLSADWHSFLCGPLRPFVECLGLVTSQNVPSWTLRAAWICLKDMKCLSVPKPYAVGWCLGFGITAANQFQKWDVELREFAKASPELKRHLFNQIADKAGNDIEAARAFCNGFCDGIQAGQEVKGRDHIFKWKLFIALKHAEFIQLSRIEVVKRVRQFISTSCDCRSEERQILKLLDDIGFPRGKSGPKRK